jgi:hypothetical protein
MLSIPFDEGGQALKRVLYLLAAVCFIGAGVCMVRFINVPDEQERLAQMSDSHDSSASDDGAATREASAPADELLRDAGMFVVGGVVCLLLARRPWPTTDERKR